MNLRHTLTSIAANLLDHRPGALPRAAPAGRAESFVPARQRTSGGWKLLRRLKGGTSADPMHGDSAQNGSDRALALLLLVRRDFVEALTDVPTAPAYRLLERIRASRSVRELWHLRPDVFDAVSMHHTQAEADCRLAKLNRHFPTRSPRSGFGLL